MMRLPVSQWKPWQSALSVWKALFLREAMVRMFGAMQRMARLQGGTPPEFLLTHPVSDSRLSDAQARAAQLSVANRYTSDTLYDMMRARALLSIHRNSPQQAAARLEQESAEEPALRYVSALIDAQNGQTDQALQTLDRLASELPDYAMLPASAAQSAGITGMSPSMQP